MINSKDVKVGDFVVPRKSFNADDELNCFTILANKKYKIRNIIVLTGSNAIVQCECENKNQLYEVVISEFNNDYANRYFYFTSVAEERKEKINEIFS